jgi:hypothetical protein
MMRSRLFAAAVANSFFLADPASATVYQFQIVSNASPVTVVYSLSTGTPGAFLKFDDVVNSYGEPNPSNTALATGTFFAEITPGVSIAFQPGASITFGTAFNYQPSTAPAQLGFEISRGSSLGGPFTNGGQGYASASGYALHFGDASCFPNGGGVLASVGGNSYAGGNNTLCGTGGIVQFSGIINGTAGGIGLPFGFSSPNTVTFDGTTIVIPVNSTRDMISPGSATRIVTSGSIVAQVVAVPEPSSLLLVGLGAFSLASRGARRRR